MPCTRGIQADTSSNYLSPDLHTVSQEWRLWKEFLFRPSAKAQEGPQDSAPQLGVISINTDSDFPRCCAGAAAPFHREFTYEEVTACCAGARRLHIAHNPGHHCFGAFQLGSAGFTVHGDGEHDNLRGSAGGVDGVFD
jgi:hypothetical protein